MANADLWSLIDKHEGGGNYSTLFGHSQRDGGRFAGIDPSNMTFAELDAFEKQGGYGQWVKDELGRSGQEARIATPAGRHQIVGTTRRNAGAALGYGDDTVFSPAVQDNIARHLATQRLASANTPEGKRAALRAEWEGFKHVSDADLDAAISSFSGGGPSQAGLRDGPTQRRAEAGLPLNTRQPPDPRGFFEEKQEYADSGLGRFKEKRDNMRAGLGEKLGLNNKQMGNVGAGLTDLSQMIASGRFG